MTDVHAPLRILAFEPFDAGSHQAVRESISRHSRHEWAWFTRPGRAWKWRMRLAAIELVEAASQAGGFDPPPNIIFVTSLLSAADLRALLPATLRAVPLVLYLHENQAAYPTSHRGEVDPKRDVHFALTNLTSALAADLVIFNSDWNRCSLLAGLEKILDHAPDAAVGEWRSSIESHSTVIWPPVEPPTQLTRAENQEPHVLHKSIRIVWPHRWEHDKGPDDLLEIAQRWTDPLNLRWTILGQQFSEVPPALVEFRARFADSIDHMGFEPNRQRYWQHLHRCDWVLSTARHEFFGIAVVEAMLAGCLPWLPDRLSYPELLPPSARNISPAETPRDPATVRNEITRHLRSTLAVQAVASLDEVIATLARDER